MCTVRLINWISPKLRHTSFQVPEVLKKYMPEEFQDEIPFVKPAPIDEEAKAAAAKKEKGNKK